MKIKESLFGMLPDGNEAKLFTLGNNHGITHQNHQLWGHHYQH